MSEYPKKVRLRDQTEITLRPMNEKDGDRLHSFFTSLPGEDRLYLRDDVTDRTVIDRWVKNIDYDHILPIIALDADKVVGDATLHVRRHGWWRHLGEIRLVVARDFQKKGLGATLARELYLHAHERHLHKLVASAMDTQIGAVRALEKLGFVTEALLKNHVSDLDGVKHNLLILSSDVEELWRRFEDVILDLEVRALHAP
ncbi:GNAT family N-acetyltransferase [Myxococcota bacterium]